MSCQNFSLFQCSGVVSCGFAGRKSFPQKAAIHSVEAPVFFHKLKTQWKKWKSPAVKPVFPVELNTFHRVFNSPYPSLFVFSVQFVIFKSELWQFFESESVMFCKILQHQIDECWFLLKSSSFRIRMDVAIQLQKCCILSDSVSGYRAGGFSRLPRLPHSCREKPTFGLILSVVWGILTV